MPLDWNWFFSTLSQSAAAIVGIFGAFIITKIFSNQALYAEKNNRLKQVLMQAEKISDTSNSYNIEWYNKHFNHRKYEEFHNYLEDNFPDIESANELSTHELDNYISKNKFSVYSDQEAIRDELIFIANGLSKENMERKKQEKFERNSSPLQRDYLLPPTLGDAILGVNYNKLYTSYGPINISPWVELDQLRSNFDQCYLEAKHHTRVALEFLEATEGNPESPKQISWALLLVLTIFFVGVIYPLSFLPASGKPEITLSLAVIMQNLLSFKGFLLAVIALSFTVIVSIFFVSNLKMKYAKNDLKKIKQLTELSHYCKYFKFRKHRSE